MPRSDSYPGSLDRRPSGSWRWRVSINGERIQETWKPQKVEAERRTDSSGRPRESLQEAAERMARGRYDELADERQRDVGSISFSRFLKRWEREHVSTLSEGSQAKYGVEARAFRTFFRDLHGDPDVGKLSKGLVKRFVSWRRVHRPDGTEREKPLADVTVGAALSILSSMLSHAVDAEYLDSNPAKRLQNKPSGSRREAYILSPKEYGKLLEALEDRPMAHTYALVVGETGLRTQSEATWLRWEDIDWQDHGLHVVAQRDGHTTKTDESRWVPASDRLMETLREHAARFRFPQYGGKPSRWVFHHVTGHRNRKAGDRVKRFTASLKKAAEKAGIPSRWRPYDLRHMRLTRWGETGKAFLVQKAAGHADISTTMRYVDVERDALRGLVDGAEEARPDRAAQEG